MIDNPDDYQAELAADLHTETQRQDQQEAVTAETLGDGVRVGAGVIASVDTNTHEVHITPDDGGAPVIAGYGSLTGLSASNVGQRALYLVPGESRQPVFDVLWTTD